MADPTILYGLEANLPVQPVDSGSGDRPHLYVATDTGNIRLWTRSGWKLLSTGIPSSAGNNQVLAGPTSGGPAAPTFRPISTADLSDFVPASTVWTPALTFVTPGDLSVAYSNQTGRVLKLGPLVVFRFVLICTPTYTTASGDMRITGLPYTSSGNASFAPGGLVWNPAWPAGATSACFTVLINSSNIVVQIIGSGNVGGNIGAANIPSGTSLNLQGTGVIF